MTTTYDIPTEYCIQATVTKTEGDTSTTTQIPTFYLNADVQGILNDAQAVRVAQRIIDPFGDYVVSISAGKV